MHKSGFVTIIGNPNVGKSTLMNELVGERLSIITNKAQTTRHRILGIVSSEDYQIVFSDTPGIINPHHNLHNSMMNFVSNSIEDADVIIYMVDCNEKELKNSDFSLKLKKNKTPVFLLINKIDLVSQELVMKRISYWSKKIPNSHIFPISAKTKFNTKLILEELVKILPNSPAYFPKDTLTDKSERFISSEIIREKIMERYKQEVPYSTEVEVDSFENKTKLLKIEATIYVERESQKAIIIGKKGIAINAIGSSARKSLQNFFNKKIFLGLYVKVSKNWRNKKLQLKKFGYN